MGLQAEAFAQLLVSMCNEKPTSVCFPDWICVWEVKHVLVKLGGGGEELLIKEYNDQQDAKVKSAM